MKKRIDLTLHTVNEVTLNLEEEGKDCGHFVEYKISDSPYVIRVMKPEYQVEYSKLMSIEEVMEELSNPVERSKDDEHPN